MPLSNKELSRPCVSTPCSVTTANFRLPDIVTLLDSGVKVHAPPLVTFCHTVCSRHSFLFSPIACFHRGWSWCLRNVFCIDQNFLKDVLQLNDRLFLNYLQARHFTQRKLSTKSRYHLINWTHLPLSLPTASQISSSSQCFNNPGDMFLAHPPITEW